MRFQYATSTHRRVSVDVPKQTFQRVYASRLFAVVEEGVLKVRDWKMLEQITYIYRAHLFVQCVIACSIALATKKKYLYFVFGGLIYFHVGLPYRSLLHFPRLRSTPAFSTVAYCTPAFWCRIFQSRIFQSPGRGVDWVCTGFIVHHPFPPVPLTLPAHRHPIAAKHNLIPHLIAAKSFSIP